MKEDDSKEEKVESKKGKRSRKQGSKRGQREGKKSGQESAAKKAKASSRKEPVTPNERPTRERKTVERYSEPLPGRASASKGLSIEKGTGTQLKDIPNVAFKLSKKKPDENLQILHTILFGKKAKIHTLKRNIGQFSGYVWVENEEEKQKAKVKEKLDKCIKEKLVDFCDVLNIPINKAIVRKEELSAKLLEFLESPHATTDVLLADKEQKGKIRKRKVTPSKSTSPGETSMEKPAKKRKQTSVGDKQRPSSEVEGEDEVEASASRDDSDEVEDNDTAMKEQSDQEETKSEEEEEEKKEQKTTKKASSRKSVKEDLGAKHRGKKASASRSVKSPAKLTKKSSSSTSKKADADDTSVAPKSKESSAKKRKAEKESQKDQSDPAKEKTPSKKRSSRATEKVSSKDLGKGKTSKKAKPEPSREEMHAVVVDILKQVDFNTATLSDILRQLGTHFDLDLMHRKTEVKAIITDVINSMSDDEDEEEEAEENAEAGNDADDKDGEGDGDGDGDDEA